MTSTEIGTALDVNPLTTGHSSDVVRERADAVNIGVGRTRALSHLATAIGGVIVAAACVTGVNTVSAAAPVGIEQIGTFAIVDDRRDILILDGEIESGSPLDLFRALKARPDAKVVLLNSIGGLVDPALIIAHEIRQRGLATIVPAGAICYSACSFIFFAGKAHKVLGALGVHQVWNDANDLVSGQAKLSDVLDALDDFGVDRGIISIMLRTPPSEMHVFSAKEIATLDINVGSALSILDNENNAAATPVDPAAVTIQPMTVTGKDAARGSSERVLTVVAESSLENILINAGLAESEIAGIMGGLLSVYPSVNLPRGAHVRILLGPSRSQAIIPYRLSIYLGWQHAVTVALTDEGQYVLGIAPTAIMVNGRLLGEPAPSDPLAAISIEKRDRLRPP